MPKGHATFLKAEVVALRTTDEMGGSWYHVSMTKYDRLRNLTLTDDGTVTPEAIVGILEHQEFLCALCGEIPRQFPVLDHIVPLSRGGTHSIVNVQMVCRRCNGEKHAKLPDWVSPNRTILEDKFFPHALESIFALPYVQDGEWE